MAKTPDQIAFLEAKDAAIENLETIRFELDRCINAGMLDMENQLYNILISIMDEMPLIKNWDGLEELISRAKTIEQDVAVWLSYHGLNTVSLSWPHRPSS